MNKGMCEAPGVADVQGVTELQILARLLGNKGGRQTTKQARQLIERYGSFAELLCVPEPKLVAGEIDEGAARVLKALRLLIVNGAHRTLKARPIIKDWNAILNYLQWTQGRASTEEVRVFYFDAKFHLIEDQVHARGTAGHVVVDPQMIIREGVRHSAYHLVLAHNHPSGDPWPSEEDILMTNRIGRAAVAVGMVLHDHIIVAHGASFSFRAAELID